MSIVATLAALAAAITSVDGLTGYALPPNAYRAGDGWGQWGGAEQVADGGYSRTLQHTYRVIVIAPADPNAAPAWVDGHLAALIDAVAPVLAVGSVAMTRLPAEGSSAAYNALVLTGETE